ncbi:uncharacterized protein LODBEIA_P37270 [Lodderomyces beijingensis]|uniref:Uncharacterized protein n=1 Tax=Lodderomyces beijingensis TaxID=1775926 RepID=A0ABP0ZN08_9ASCO
MRRKQEPPKFQNNAIDPANTSTSAPRSIFSRRRSSTQTPDQRPPSSSAPEFKFEVLHRGGPIGSRDDAVASGNRGINVDNEAISPTASDHMDQHSIALSSAETLSVGHMDRRELQPSYTENLTEYLPFVLRRHLHLEVERRQREEGSSGSPRGVESELERPGNAYGVDDADADAEEEEDEEEEDDDDDLATIFSQSHLPMDQEVIETRKVMSQKLTSFNYKRSLVLMNGMLLNHKTYIFPTPESFDLFKELRSKVKQERRNSVILFDRKNGGIRRASSSASVDKIKRDFKIPEGSEEVIDDRNHIIPIDYKIKGLGLPLFKVSSPVMSVFRKNAPFLTFRKYKEIPAPPALQESPSTPDCNETEVDFETFDFCLVHSKYFQNFRRFIYEFLPNSPHAFKVISFQSNFAPFTDFIFQNTRFRILGTAVIPGFVSPYTPHMKLVILDESQPSLCDAIYNKPPSQASTFLHFKKEASPPVRFDINDPQTFINPVPCKNNDFAYKGAKRLGGASYKLEIIPFGLPPFGCFKDASLYVNSHMFSIPKKYKEVGKIEVYQNLDRDDLIGDDYGGGGDGVFPVASSSSDSAPPSMAKDVNSTLSVDVDTQVLTCILSTMREVNIKNSASSGQSNGIMGPSFASRVGGIGPAGGLFVGV